MSDSPPIAEPQELYGEREQCSYVFQKGVNINQQCSREIPLGNRFCKTHSKTAFAKKLLSSNGVEEEVVEERKKSFDKLPSKKKEKEEPDVDSDTEVIHLPQIEEEDLEEILAGIPDEDELEEGEEEGPVVEDDEQLIIQQIKLYYRNLPFLDEELPFDQKGK